MASHGGRGTWSGLEGKHLPLDTLSATSCVASNRQKGGYTSAWLPGCFVQDDLDSNHQDHYPMLPVSRRVGHRQGHGCGSVGLQELSGHTRRQGRRRGDGQLQGGPGTVVCTGNIQGGDGGGRVAARCRVGRRTASRCTFCFSRCCCCCRCFRRRLSCTRTAPTAHATAPRSGTRTRRGAQQTCGARRAGTSSRCCLRQWCPPRPRVQPARRRHMGGLQGLLGGCS